MDWFRRRSTPWLLVAIQTVGGSCAAGLLAAGAMFSRQMRDPIPCFLDGCETEIALAAMLAAATYFVASLGAGAALGVSEVTGAGSAGVRSWLAIVGPPLLWVTVYLMI
jgi:hypothetical protein